MTEEPTDVSIIQLTQKERPADRFLASTVHELSHARKVISFLSVVEIVDAWNPARELGVSIPQTFVRLFANSDHQSVLTKFEDALKGINKLLGEARIKSASPINCILTLVSGDEVYLASVGEVGLLLLRNGRLSHLSADTKDGSNEFTTVTSGELTSEDWLFVTNQNLGNLIEDLPIGEITIAATSERALKTFLEDRISLEDRRILAGCVVRYAPEAGQLATVYLDEVESRTPISLPKFSAPQLKLPRVSLLALGPMLAVVQKLTHRLSMRQWALLGMSLVIAIAIIIGVTRISNRQNESATPKQTLISNMAGLSASEIRQFANTRITHTAFGELNTADQTMLENMLAASELSLVTLPKELSTLPNKIVAIDSVSETELYLVDTTGQLWKWQNQLLTKLDQKQLINQPVSLVAFSPTKIVVSDAAGNLWFFDGSISQPESLAMPTKLATGPKSLQKYGNNLYLYHTDNQIYRVTNYTKDVSGAVVNVKAAALATVPVTDFAINGNIWAANAAGDISLLRRGAVVTKLKINPSSSQVHLAATEPTLVITDSRLMTVVDTANNTMVQKILVADQTISDITPCGTTGWWLTIADKLYLLSTQSL